MNTRRKPIIDPEDMGKNPFIVNQIIKARTFNSEDHYSIQSEDGYNLVTGSLKTAKLVEEQTYTKLYHDTDFRDLLLSLNEKGSKLLIYIMYQIDSNEDYIWINNVHYQNITKYKYKDYEEGLKELIRHSVLATTIFKNTYFINPMILFCGNRLKKYPNNVSIRK